MKDEMMNKKIGEWLVERRTRAGLTLQQVADRFGVSKVAVHYWEVGKNGMSASQLMHFCQIVGADPDDLRRHLFGGS